MLDRKERFVCVFPCAVDSEPGELAAARPDTDLLTTICHSSRMPDGIMVGRLYGYQEN